jgi:hypothetical protein
MTPRVASADGWLAHVGNRPTVLPVSFGRLPGTPNRNTPVTIFRLPLAFVALDGGIGRLDPLTVPIHFGHIRGRSELGLVFMAVLYQIEVALPRWVLCRYRSDPSAAAVPGKEWEREESPRELTDALAMAACQKYGIKPPAALLAQMPEIPSLAAETPPLAAETPPRKPPAKRKLARPDTDAPTLLTTTQATEPPLRSSPTSEARDLLLALRLCDATNPNHRQPWPVVCERAGLRLNDRCSKRARDQLRKAGLVRSKLGRDGGVWLTPPGADLAQELGQNSVN